MEQRFHRCNDTARDWLFRVLLHTDRRAVTALEYGLIAGLIALAIIPGVKLLAPEINKTLGTISTALH